MSVSLDVKDCGDYVVFEFEEFINNGWATVGCVRHKVNLDKKEVTSIVEKLSEWLKNKSEKGYE